MKMLLPTPRRLKTCCDYKACDLEKPTELSSQSGQVPYGSITDMLKHVNITGPRGHKIPL